MMSGVTMEEAIIEKTVAFVKNELRDAEGGHDWFHIQRVWNNAKKIAEAENANHFVVELGALLHDVADSKFYNGDEEIGPAKALKFMEEAGIAPDVRHHVEMIIRSVSFKGGHNNTGFFSAELAVVRDADRLDAMGAIGIARAFNYGGFKNRAIYDPAVKPQPSMTKEQYKNSTAPTINHFYEKLLLLRDGMYTSTGRMMAEQRHRFMEVFLVAFFDECGDTNAL